MGADHALDRLNDTDGDPNSIYTRKLLPLLKQPGLQLPVVAQRVRREVSQLANTVGHRQSPAYYDEGADDVCLAGCGAASAGVQPQGSEAERAWDRTKDTTNVAVLEAFITRYKDTFFADLARARLDELKKQQVAIATPPAAQTPAAPSPTPEPKTAQSPVRNERNFRLASSFPKVMTEIVEPSEQFVREVQRVSSGRLKVQLFAAGEIVPGLQVLDSVMNGTIELGWTFAFYYFGKNPAFAFIGGGVPLGIDATTFVRWLEGPGKAVRAEVYTEAGVKAFPCSISGPKGLWLRKEVKRLNDLKGLKLRVGGTTSLSLLATEIVPQQLATGDICPALEKGTIDGLEWFTPPMDEKMAWHKVAKYYYYPFGEPTFSAVSDLLVNKKVWDELEPAARNVIENACRRQLHNDLGRLSDGAAAAMQRMRALGAIIDRLPEPIAAKHREGAKAYLGNL